MRVIRLTWILGLLFTISLLVACGGGGGGTTPNVSSPTSTPGGPPPTSSSPKASASPSPSPSPSPSARPSQSASPSPTPSATLSPTPSPTPTATPNRNLTKGAGNGEINGNDTMFTDGISAANERSDGDYSNGGQGPTGTAIGPDAVPCLTSMYEGPVGQPGDGYHVHPFVGMYYNGVEVALPDGIGFADPGADGTFSGISNWTEYASNCYYQMHTHDASGLIHIEAFPPAPSGAYGGQLGTLYTLGDFLAVWGIPISATNWGPLNGTVTIYTSGQVPRGGPGTNPYVYSNTYTLYCTACDPATVSAIPLYSHEVIWVLVGTGNPIGSSLPNVLFFTEW
jgi:hypothetical protein